MRPSPAERWNDLGQALFGSTGWLFADLMLALAMAFLVANTVGQRPLATTTTTTTTNTVPPTTTTVSGLDRKPVVFDLRVDRDALQRGDGRAIRAAQRMVRSREGLGGRRAGLVLAFGGARGLTPDRGEALARTVNNRVLGGLTREGVFRSDTVYEPYHDLQRDPNVVHLKIYLFR